ncbi:MAG: PAS domain-containing protein [Sulfitobacter sp.]
MDKHQDNAQNVMAMSDYQPETGYAAIAQVEAYWEAIRGSRLLPKRSDIDPRGIEHALENAFILERIAPGIARLRIAGSHLNTMMGMEVRGMPLTAFFTSKCRPEVSELLEVVFQTPAIGSLKLSSPAAINRPEVKARLVLLPLKSDLGDVSRVLGCFVSQGELGLAPRRFEVQSQEVLQISVGTSMRTTDRPVEPFVPKVPPRSKKNPKPPARAMKEDATSFEPQKGQKRPPYLRLIKSDE